MKYDMQVNAINKISKLLNSEGIVLLKNDDHLLPLNGKINLFGRIQFNYYKSGTGSGGLVNTPYVYSLFDIMNSSPFITLNQELVQEYHDFVRENPFNNGNGTWASEPWSQEEMPVSLDLVQKAKEFSDIAVIVIGRTAGEDRDIMNERGSYQLSETELLMIKNVTSIFDKVVLILNVGTIIDLSEVIDDVEAVLLAYHGGYYGAISIYEILLGISLPSGSLPFTVLKDIKKDITSSNFGTVKTTYHEDIYVGYRYHHTFEPENILFPLGFGLSYSEFELHNFHFSRKETVINISYDHINLTDNLDNKTVYIYVEAPNGLLGKPKYELLGFHKPSRFTGVETVNIDVDLWDVASFDDLGKISKGSFILEKGQYLIHIGFHLGDYKHTFEFELIDDIISNPKTLINIDLPFKRIINNNQKLDYEEVEAVITKFERSTNLVNYKPNRNTFEDLLAGEITTTKLVEGLSNDDLRHLVKGEGMSSSKVTPGIAGAVGGITPALQAKKIPILAFSDGPSGIRMDSGFLASSLPNGALLASSFQLDLIELLFTAVGLEMTNYKIDILLGPGVNIYRNVLNGRNFEYFSEDPIITGRIASTILKGLHQQGRDGSLKHFICNNQETNRFTNEVVVSNRAFREIYLKGYEIAIKEGNAKVIMSSYNYLNGYHAISHPLLYDKILREELGFNGILISDWWAHLNKSDEPLDRKRLSNMIKASHDLYMVVSDTTTYDDDLKQALELNELTRSDLAKVSINIINYMVHLVTEQNEAKIVNKELNSELLSDTFIKIGDVTSNRLVIEAELANGVKKILPKGAELFELNHSGIIFSNTDTIHVINPIVKEKSFEIPSDLTPIILSPNVSEMVTLDQDIESYKDKYYHYKIEVLESANYTFSFKIHNHSSQLSQTSFNMYFNEVFDKTFTYGKFDGVLGARLIKNLPKGIYTFSIKFNQAGLYFDSIEVRRHP